jgi:hypothetical protein
MIDPIRTGGPPPLDAFRTGASQGETVRVTVDGEQFKVLGEGRLEGGAGARSVSWVQGEVDTTGFFLQALTQSYGGGLSDAIARELGLDPAPGKPLASRSVLQALDMAQTGRGALAGVDFLTQLDLSAGAQGPGFRSMLKELGLEEGRITREQCSELDARMQARFEQAAARGESPVAPGTAREWLRAEIASLGLP